MRNEDIQIDIDSILSATEIAQKNILAIKETNKATTLVIGPSGAGKSTLINYLSGVELVLENDSIGKNKYSVAQPESDKPYAPIGHEGSMTSQPQFLTSSDQQYYFADTAGLLDSRSIDNRVHAALTIALMAKALTIKGLLLVINLDTISGGRASIVDDLFKALAPFFYASTQIHQSIQLVISNKDPTISNDQARQVLTELLMRFKQDNKHANIIRCFLGNDDRLSNVHVFNSLEPELRDTINTYYSHAPNITFTSAPALLEESTRDKLSSYFQTHERVLASLLTRHDELSCQLTESETAYHEKRDNLETLMQEHGKLTDSITHLKESLATQSDENTSIKEALNACDIKSTQFEMNIKNLCWQVNVLKAVPSDIVGAWCINKTFAHAGLFQFQFSGHFAYDQHLSHCSAGQIIVTKPHYIVNNRKSFAATFEVQANAGQSVSASILLLKRAKQASHDLVNTRLAEIQHASKKLMQIEGECRSAITNNEASLFTTLQLQHHIEELNKQLDETQLSANSVSSIVDQYKETVASKQSDVSECRAQVKQCKGVFTLFQTLPSGTFTPAVTDAVNQQLQRCNK